MKFGSVIIAAMVALVGAGVASANHSHSPCGSEVTAIGGQAATFYLVNDDTGTWLYFEENEHDGLQRGGSGFAETGDGTGTDTACWDIDNETEEPIENPDTVIF